MLQCAAAWADGEADPGGSRRLAAGVFFWGAGEVLHLKAQPPPPTSAASNTCSTSDTRQSPVPLCAVLRAMPLPRAGLDPCDFNAQWAEVTAAAVANLSGLPRSNLSLTSQPLPPAPAPPGPAPPPGAQPAPPPATVEGGGVQEVPIAFTPSAGKRRLRRLQEAAGPRSMGGAGVVGAGRRLLAWHGGRGPNMGVAGVGSGRLRSSSHSSRRGLQQQGGGSPPSGAGVQVSRQQG